MNKLLKTILISSIAVFSAGFLLIPSTSAQAQGLEVVFENEPDSLFDETNFLPGESVTRYADVTNNSGETKKIGLEIINQYPCSENCLSDVLDLVINENGNPLPLYSDSLTNFYGAGEKVLSDLSTGATIRYYFSMTFNPVAGNVYQNSTADFDINIGFFGEESIGEEIPSGGGGGGGYFIPGLEIYDETASEIGENEVTITWQTNKDATSRVIYSSGSESHTLTLDNPPNYGYAHTTLEYDISPKVTFHSVTITGLTPGTTYYYRTVSHGSLAISQEYTFITKGVKGWEIEEGGKPAEEIGIPEITGEIPEEITEEGIPSAPLSEEEMVIVPPERGLASMVAAIGMVMGEISQSAWKIIVVILSLMGLIVVGAKEWKEAREKKKG